MLRNLRVGGDPGDGWERSRALPAYAQKRGQPRRGAEGVDDPRCCAAAHNRRAVPGPTAQRLHERRRADGEPAVGRGDHRQCRFRWHADDRHGCRRRAHRSTAGCARDEARTSHRAHRGALARGPGICGDDAGAAVAQFPRPAAGRGVGRGGNGDPLAGPVRCHGPGHQGDPSPGSWSGGVGYRPGRDCRAQPGRPRVGPGCLAGAAAVERALCVFARRLGGRCRSSARWSPAGSAVRGASTGRFNGCRRAGSRHPVDAILIRCWADGHPDIPSCRSGCRDRRLSPAPGGGDRLRHPGPPADPRRTHARTGRRGCPGRDRVDDVAAPGRKLPVLACHRLVGRPGRTASGGVGQPSACWRRPW